MFEVEGTLGDVNFYRKDGELLVRRVGRVSAEKIRTEKAFERTRENNAEFKICATAGRLIRQSLTDLLRRGKDNKVSSRMLSLMFKLRKMDTESPRGERQVYPGLDLPEGKQLLKGFEFNIKSEMGEIINSRIALDSATESLTLTRFTPQRDIALHAPDATHITLSFMSAAFDLKDGLVYSGRADSVNIPIDADEDDYQLQSELIEFTGTKVYALLIEFFQEVNGRQYALHNGQYNMCKILEVM